MLMVVVAGSQPRILFVAPSIIDSTLYVPVVTPVCPPGKKYDESKGICVDIKKAEGLELVAHVRGDFNDFLKAVSKHTLTDLDVTHVSLEDMFMRFYK